MHSLRGKVFTLLSHPRRDDVLLFGRLQWTRHQLPLARVVSAKLMYVGLASSEARLLSQATVPSRILYIFSNSH